jgi:alkylated DNA repair dioxygenase AlkB
MVDFLRRITGHELLLCPGGDPHAYALYYHTEPGDHIGYHYDTSYYEGARFTVLAGLVDESSSVLECRLHRDDAERATESRRLALAPGMLVVFNGDKLYHRVTPLGRGEPASA